MDIQAPPSYEYVEPPSYTAHSNIASTSHAVSPTRPEQDYRYKGDNLVLCLGPKRFGIIRPTYGWNDDIIGHVLIKRNIKKVKSIKVHIEGTMVVGLSEGGFLVDQKRVSVLKASQTLLEISEGQQDITCMEGLLYPFTFPLPSYVTGGMEPLPPTSSVIHMGMTASVTYFIKVEMIRNGKLRANERTFTSSPGQFGNAFSNDEKYEEPGSVVLNQWQAFDILPKIPSDTVPLSPCSLQVSLHLRKPLVYASDSSFPFRIELVSPDIDPLLALFSNLAIDLIRVTTISMGNRWTVRETVVGQGRTQHIEETPRQKIIYGEVTCSDQGESSWRAEHIDVKHLLKIKLSPRANSPSLSKSLPIFSHYVSVVMRTHLRDETDIHDTRLPALSRLPRQFLGITP
ncbi:hypothetical protein Clacol_002633 [Clathrus columnatus]|uniref:Arrestin-like N-terminal domain-containing protein n=1 Tax=Clathrus columnatus TaxID=1419009 RepID=A0AAV5A1A9_9AGAM|nr:hypothetical protein Clacol_002633 [Clathrus columnatus]